MGKPGRARARQGSNGAPGLPAGCGRGPGHKSAGPGPTPTWSGPGAAASHGRAAQPRIGAHPPHTCPSQRPGQTAPETLCLRRESREGQGAAAGPAPQSPAPALVPPPTLQHETGLIPPSADTELPLPGRPPTGAGTHCWTGRTQPSALRTHTFTPASLTREHPARAAHGARSRERRAKRWVASLTAGSSQTGMLQILIIAVMCVTLDKCSVLAHSR